MSDVRRNTGAITIVSSDRKFMVSLLDWLDKRQVKKDSTVIQIHAADDDEPVTEEWLEALGARGVSQAGNVYFDVPMDGGDDWRTWLRIHSPHDGGCPVDVFLVDDGVQSGVGLTKAWPNTRGQVRYLLIALGIKE